ncbi:9395_t:CDS:2 [Funneliformis mosseae]|uniref:9395_t:CDS:1 n=1 Tax=Funneliformis mosseae TaxID=27381 RepID=A0A9N8ZS55_FUNMO|nr:9395_t:CDS:2 [Funneliformis mosseae]
MQQLKQLDADEINKKFSERSWRKYKKSPELKEEIPKPESFFEVEDSIRVVIGFDFGTTYSGFTYCHVSEEKNLCSNDLWHGEVGQLKTNTVLQYDDEYNNVRSWGAPALVKKPNRRDRNRNNENKPVELFKLHLENILDNFKPKLSVDYKKAITDYIREIGKVIKETISIRWPKIDFFEHVLLVLTVPAEFSEKTKAIMRMCVYDAGLTKDECSKNLQFTTEPEAAAVYCMKNRTGSYTTRKYVLFESYFVLNILTHLLNHLNALANFMIVDCGGGTVDLTTRKFINEEELGEITERTGDFCGSTFIDTEFIKYLRKKLGDKPMDSLKEKHYGQMQYLIQHFCKSGKIPFTGDDPNFLYELDIQDTVPVLKQYITDENIINTLDDWVVEIDFETMKLIFEPVIQKILLMIKAQLDNAQETCSAMFLVGGFSESRYLQNRIKQEFLHRVNNISVPIQPMAAIARGAVIYGLSIKSNNLNNIGDDDNLKCIISSRVLKYTYGIKSRYKWVNGDPVSRRTHDGYISKFSLLARRGTKMNVNQEITRSRVPIYPNQTKVTHYIYYTREYDGIYCDDPGMKLLGKLHADLPGSGLNRPVLFGLTFGQMEFVATSKNKLTGQSYRTTFKYNLED